MRTLAALSVCVAVVALPGHAIDEKKSVDQTCSFDAEKGTVALADRRPFRLEKVSGAPLRIFALLP